MALARFCLDADVMVDMLRVPAQVKGWEPKGVGRPWGGNDDVPTLWGMLCAGDSGIVSRSFAEFREDDGGDRKGVPGVRTHLVGGRDGGHGGLNGIWWLCLYIKQTDAQFAYLGRSL